MTNKELLYVEDVLGHEKHSKQCREPPSSRTRS